MKRWGIWVVICIALGGITTIAVAWTCARLIPLTKNDTIGRALSSDQVPCWWIWTYQRPGTYWAAGFPIIHENSYDFLLNGYCEDGVLSAYSFSYRGIFLTQPNSDDYESIRQQAIAAHGWPMLALWCEVNSEWLAKDKRYKPESAKGGGVDDSNIDLAPSRRNLAAFGLRPLWLGFLVDSLFYAVLWPIAFISVLTIWKLFLWPIRKFRHRCVKCGYDLRGGYGGGCPECGWGREAEA